MNNWIALFYLIAGVCFILALRGLSSPKTASRGTVFGMVGMLIAIVATLIMTQVGLGHIILILVGIGIGGGIGLVIAKKIHMTALPQLVAAFHSLVGLAAVCVALAAFYSPQAFGIGVSGNIDFPSLIEMGIGTAIGAITFTGSIIAFGKLQGIFPSASIKFKFQNTLNALLGLMLIGFIVLLCTSSSAFALWAVIILSLAIGILLIIPIGGADMPVVVSMLNSYSGWAACGIGFTLGNPALIITGALVGASGAILSYIMCKAMNRSFFSVILGGFGAVAATKGQDDEDRPVKAGSAEDAAFMLQNATSVIIVPGYGMAVAQAQHALREMADKLKAAGIRVRYAIHPVAGRMPGHMNVLLAEARVPYEDVFELEDINREFAQTDVAFVIGANDVTNPSAKTDKTSPIYGMPILDVGDAAQILFVKRSLSPGYAGVQNELFYADKTMMLFGDAKKMTENIVKSMDD